MRTELAELLAMDWHDTEDGLGGVVSKILAMKPTEEEMQGLSELLISCEETRKAYVIIRFMREAPRDFHRPRLVQALESCNVRIRSSAARALMNAEYEGAVDAVLASRGAIDALGDEFPRMMLRYAEDLPEDKQKFLLEEFLHRVSERPSLEAARDWLRMVSMIFIQDERLTPILFKTWQEMPKGTDWFSDRLALLDAMATHPDPSFKPAFEHAAKSRDDEIKAIGRTGLHVLAEVAAGRWPFEKPTKGQ